MRAVWKWLEWCMQLSHVASLWIMNYRRQRGFPLEAVASRFVVIPLHAVEMEVNVPRVHVQSVYSLICFSHIHTQIINVGCGGWDASLVPKTASSMRWWWGLSGRRRRSHPGLLFRVVDFPALAGPAGDVLVMGVHESHCLLHLGVLICTDLLQTGGEGAHSLQHLPRRSTGHVRWAIVTNNEDVTREAEYPSGSSSRTDPGQSSIFSIFIYQSRVWTLESPYDYGWWW